MFGTCFGLHDEGRDEAAGVVVMIVVLNCAVVGTISSEGVAFHATFHTSPQKTGDKFCGDVCNVA